MSPSKRFLHTSIDVRHTLSVVERGQTMWTNNIVNLTLSLRLDLGVSKNAEDKVQKAGSELSAMRSCDGEEKDVQLPILARTWQQPRQSSVGSGPLPCRLRRWALRSACPALDRPARLQLQSERPKHEISSVSCIAARDDRHVLACNASSQGWRSCRQCSWPSELVVCTGVVV